MKKKLVYKIFSVSFMIFYFLSSLFSQVSIFGNAQELSLSNNKIESVIDNDFIDNVLTLYSDKREASLSIDTGSLSPLIETIDNVLTVKHITYDVKIYPIINGLEFDIIIYNNPDPINTFKFPLNLDGLTAYYQAPLNEELKPLKGEFLNETHLINEKGEVIIYRPLNVVGSYAIYHDNKIGNEYKSGKVFHLYRPLVYDNNSKLSMYADLNINSDNELIITVPKEIIINGEYPLTIDPTFGKDDKGGTSASIGADFSITLRTANPEATSVDITGIGAYIMSDQSGDRQAKVAIYDHDVGNDRAGNLVHESGEQDILYLDDQWFAFPDSVHDSFPSGNCWLAIILDDTLTIYWDAGTTNSWRYKAMTYPTFSDPWGVPSWSAGRFFSIYVNYTVVPVGAIYGITHNSLDITNMDIYKGDNTLFMFKWYEFQANITEGNYTLSTNEIAFTDNTEWANVTFDYNDTSFTRETDYNFIDLNLTSSYNTTDVYGNIIIYYHLMLKGKPDNVLNISLYMMSEDDNNNVTGWEEVQNDYTHILKKVLNSSIVGTLGTIVISGGVEVTTFVLDNAVLLADVFIIILGLISLRFGIVGLLGVGLGFGAVIPIILLNTLDSFVHSFSIISVLVVTLLFLAGSGLRMRNS